MTIVADTNVLLRFFAEDDPAQHKLARMTMEQAETVAVTNVALCELLWVLRSRYGVTRENLEKLILQMQQTDNLVLDAGALDAGLATLQAGADFADGVIAHEGAWLGGETFVSFDKKAVTALAKQGRKSKLLR